MVYPKWRFRSAELLDLRRQCCNRGLVVFHVLTVLPEGNVGSMIIRYAEVEDRDRECMLNFGCILNKRAELRLLHTPSY